MYKEITTCRACGERLPFLPVFDLGLQPLANDFVSPGQERAGYAPLNVLLCSHCSLAQLSVVVNPQILYSHYPYVTSPSATMLNHFDVLWRGINEESKAEHVLEIGSNDGAFLAYAKEYGAHTVVGVDPAANLTAIAKTKGVFSYNCAFDSDAAKMIQGSMPRVDVVVARHVFAHIDDWHETIRSLDDVSGKDTLIVIEVPYVLDLLKNAAFDTIYHEHLSYVNLHALQHLLERTVFRLHKVMRVDLHGGSIVVMLRRRDCDIDPLPIAAQMLKAESITEEHWAAFKENAWHKIIAMLNLISDLGSQKKRVVGFGASAKSTVWINKLNLTRDDIEFIVDATPQKQGKLSPGSDIPIVDPGALLREQPDYAICFASNYRDEILATNKGFTGKFIFPGLKPEIVHA